MSCYITQHVLMYGRNSTCKLYHISYVNVLYLIEQDMLYVHQYTHGLYHYAIIGIIKYCHYLLLKNTLTCLCLSEADEILLVTSYYVT